ncbi:MAG: hypothetical protein N3F66_07155 [Spirochaetes bacterium]|nr:hypothetical protein [Spirochaetota bacterium]
MNFDGRSIPSFFVEVLKDFNSLSQIGYAFLLGLNSYTGNDQIIASSSENEELSQEENLNNEEE